MKKSTGMKMENYTRMINDVFKSINWNLVLNFYRSQDDYHVVPGKKNRIKIKLKSEEEIKKELKDLILFTLEGNFRELHHEQWIIYWKNLNGTSKLEVLFAPVRAASSDTGEEEESEPEIDDVTDVERQTLTNMLTRSIEEENYELSAVIHSRLKRLNKKSKS